jgi:hypothetical protein
MPFAVLTGEGPDRARWRSLVGGLSRRRDVHFLPEYGDIYRRTYGFEPFLAVYENDRRFVVQPFVRRPLEDLPFLRDQQISRRYHDIASPYGYGGPVSSGGSPDEEVELFEAFNARFVEYCRRERLASEFTSVHPFLDAPPILMKSGAVKLTRQKEVVYVDLPGSEALRWKATRKGHRSSITKARRNGVRIEKVSPAPGNVELLNRLYYETMERNRAAARWIFPHDYFGNCIECLGDARVSLFFAYAGQALASASIVMHDFETVYYHFSGSDERYYDLCPNNLMVFEIATWAEAAGYRRFHLGGGVSSSPDDSLYVFKSGFSDKSATLYAYHRVLDQPTYDELCALKEKHERATGAAVADPDFFPLYRR